MKQLLQPLIDGFYRILEVILVINMIIMFVLVFVNVVLRLGFNTGIDFAEEVPRFAFIWMTFVGAVIGMRKHTHLGVDMVVAVLPLLGRKACWATSADTRSPLLSISRVSTVRPWPRRRAAAASSKAWPAARKPGRTCST